MGIIGMPTFAIQSGTIYLFSLYISQFLASCTAAYIVCPTLYKYKIPTTYSLIRYKFDERVAKFALIFSYPLIVINGGIRLYITVIAAHNMVPFNINLIF